MEGTAAMEITAGQVKELRDETGAGMLACKKALEATDGDIEAAKDRLRARGAAKVKKRSGKSASEGAVGSYVHMGGKIGVLIEVNCETDFVARTDDFQDLVQDLAMQVAASSPLGVATDDIPDDVVERERGVFRDQLENEGKPEHLWDRIIDGKVQKFYAENALLEQPFIKDTDKTVNDHVTEVAAKTGEKIVVRRFTRFELGE